MALVRNTASHAVPLTVGSIAAGQELNIDIALPYESDLVTSGVLIVVDGDTSPPEPNDPYARRERNLFVADVEPENLQPSDVWIKPTGTGSFEMWEKT
jgi:hypothetical protein